MNNQSYYRSTFDESGGANCCEDGVPLAVNCAGYAAMARGFWTNGKRHDYYLQLMDAGALTCGIPKHEFILSGGEFIVHPPESVYRYGQPHDCDIGYYWAHFTGNYVETLLKNSGISCGSVYSIPEEIPASVKRDFGVMFHEFMMRGIGFEDLCAAKLTSIIVDLGRAASGVRAERENRFSALLEYIHCHYTEELHISDLAAAEHLSVSRFRDVFREAFGCAPSEYIIGLRLQHARDLLTGTDLTIAEIANLCGYSDELYFMRLFRKKNGVSARTYRLAKI